MKNTAVIDFSEAQESAEELVKRLTDVADEAANIISLLQEAAKAGNVGEQWATRYGEVMEKVKVTEVLGVSALYLENLCRDGKISLNKDGWVVTRSAAAWAVGEWAEKKKVKKPTRARYTPIV